MDATKQVVEGEIAYILWSGSSPHYKAPLATDTFVMRDGKIVDVEVYFGWSIPHEASEGGFVEAARA